MRTILSTAGAFIALLSAIGAAVEPAFAASPGAFPGTAVALRGGDGRGVGEASIKQGLGKVSLRSRPKDLSSEELRSLLLEYGFYATCWTYNGDFCNPNGDFENDYTDNQDGTVTDARTGLMWQKGGSQDPVTWSAASEYVERLNQEAFAGYSDWRLPTVPELASLMERCWENDDVFVAAVFESGQKYCWSADTRGVERAWKANFHLGFFLDFPVTEENSVRAVRSLNPER